MLSRSARSSRLAYFRPARALKSPTSAHRFLSTPPSPIDPNLTTLLRNTELSIEEAQNELRWIQEEARESVQRQAASIFGTALPKKEDIQAMRGLEQGVIMGLVERRAQGEPLQYILGYVDFGPLSIICRAPTLIPRSETAHIFIRLADELTASAKLESNPLHVLDLCSGSGCIPLLLSHQLQHHLQHAIGLDVSRKALNLSKENAQALGIANVSFAEMDIFSQTFISDIRNQMKGNKVSILTANPPYISQKEWEALPASVKRYEDPRALLGDQDGNGDGKGLAFYRRIADLLPDLLVSEKEMASLGWAGVPRVVLEIGEGQAKDVEEIIRGAGSPTARIEVWQDQYGKDRAVVGWTA